MARSRSHLDFWLRLVVSTALIALLLTRVQWSELRELAAGVRPLWFAPVFLGMLLTTILSSLKWSIFLRADGIHVPLPRLTAAYWISTFFSCFLPSSIGGDIYRVHAIGKTHGASRSVAAVMMGRLTGFFVMALIGLVTALLVRDRIDDPRVLWSIGSVLILIMLAFLAVGSRRVLAGMEAILGVVGLARIGEVARGVQESVLGYRSRFSILGGALLVSVVQQLCVLISISFLARCLGIDTSIFYFLAFVPVIEALAAIPISIFGVGVRDSGYVLLFGTVGLSEVQSLGISLLYVTVTLVYASCGGLLYLLRPAEARAASDGGEEPYSQETGPTTRLD